MYSEPGERYVEYLGNNITAFRVGNRTLAVLDVSVRGAAAHDETIERWQEVARWKFKEPYDPEYRNSYIRLRAEPQNKYDRFAIAAVCCGEAYGKLGYVAKEQTDDVRRLSALSGIAIGALDCTVANYGDIGWKTVHVLVSAFLPND